MKKRFLNIEGLAALAALSVFVGFSAQAADQQPIEKKGPAAPSMEQRAKMAVVHEKMATCLKTEKPIEECHKEMWSTCQETMGKDQCPMMRGPMGGPMGGPMHRPMNGMKPGRGRSGGTP